MKIPPPRLYLGTMTFGWTGQTSSIVNEQVATNMVQQFLNHGHVHVDTARIYANGATEPICGHVQNHLFGSKSNPPMILWGTKAHPSQPMGLSPNGIQRQLDQSLQAMGVSSVEEFYLHQPDTDHSLLESLRYTHQLVQQGTIRTVGMSNYHVEEMKRAFDLCEIHSLTKPTLYQGLYNPLNRLVEEELIPLLKENGCSFVAYNPLAAGLLTGKHSLATNIDADTTAGDEDETGQGQVQAGRFKDNPNYLPRFYTKDNFEALALIQDACQTDGISLIEATFRWLLFHSSLCETDGVLLGASSLPQLKENLEACREATVVAETASAETASSKSRNKDESETGPLSNRLLQAFDSAWEITEPNAFPYWRSYSLDMPNRENLDQGASYSAAKK